VPLAKSLGATVILMDDGFQNPSVAKDASLIVIDGNRGLGNGQVLPAGPLRAPLKPQLARTDALVIVGDGTAAEAVAEQIAAQGKPVLRAHLQPDAAQVASLRGKRVLAFAGIGDPARFFATLEVNGIHVSRGRAFADHHPFARREIDGLLAEAARDGLTLVTTEKDLARMQPEWAQAIVPFAVTLEFEDEALLRKFIAARLFKARERKMNEGD